MAYVGQAWRAIRWKPLSTPLAQMLTGMSFAGGICSLSAFGQTIVVVNSAQVAMDMLDKKSSKYSDRPVMRKFWSLLSFPLPSATLTRLASSEMGGELCGWKKTLVLTPYGEWIK